MPFSTYARGKLYDAIYNATPFGLAANPWISLHTADPGLTGTNEVVGGSYARLQADFGTQTNGAGSNSANIDYPLMPAVTVTHVGVWDANVAGNFVIGGALVSPKIVNAGDTLRIPATDLDAVVD